MLNLKDLFYIKILWEIKFEIEDEIQILINKKFQVLLQSIESRYIIQLSIVDTKGG